MSALIDELERELRGMSLRISNDPAHNVRGVVQFAGSDDRDTSFYLDVGAEVALHRGVHPAPSVKVTAHTQVFLNMFRGKFAFFDPNALDQLAIDGDPELLLPLFSYVGDSDQKLEPFELAASIRQRRPPLTSVPRVENPTESLLMEAMAEYQPLLITGAVERWPWLAKSLTIDSLVTMFGDQQLTAARETEGTQAETVAGFIQRCRAGARMATAGLIPRAIRNAVGYPGYFNPEDYRWPFFFMGAQGAVSPIHRDLAHNLATHLFGAKRWRIFSPDQAEFLYPNTGPDDGPSAQTCLVDVEAPDLERFPLYANAKPIDLVVNAGEILFVPSGWFHHVNALDLCLNIAYSLKWDKGRPGEIKVNRRLIDLTAGEEGV
jgi:cupin-like protein